MEGSYRATVTDPGGPHAGGLGLEIEDVPKHAAFPEKAAVTPRLMQGRFELGNHAEREAGTGRDIPAAADQLGCVDDANRLRQDRPARHPMKSSRWLLLRNRENVTREADRVRLDELLNAHPALFTVYVLKDDLKTLWDYRHPGYALRFRQQWYGRAIRSRIETVEGIRASAEALPAGHPCTLPLAARDRLDRRH